MVSSSPSNLTVREVLNRQIQDFTMILVAGELTSGGIQYSPAVSTGSPASTNVVIFSKTISPPKAGNIVYTELGLTAEFSTTSGVLSGLTMVHRWQAKNNADSTWTNLHSGINTQVSTTWLAATMQGYYTSAVTQAPFDIRLLLNCNDLNAQGRVHNASYVRTIYY